MISVRLVEFSGSGSRSGLPRRKRRGTPDVHLLRDSADQDRIIGAPAGGRRAIASNAVSRCQLNKRFRFQPDIHRR